MTVASTSAATILAELGQDFVVPTVNLADAQFQLPDHSLDGLYDTLPEREIADLTTGIVGGDGTFDKLMASHKAHLAAEFEKGRITGAEYTKAYIELTAMAMQGGMEFLFRARESQWSITLAQFQAKKAEIEAVMSGIQLQTAKYQLAASSHQVNLLKAQHALTTMQLANEDIKYDLAGEQLKLVKEQTEAQRAQTLDTRTDGASVKGMIGKQKDLYAEQVLSYQKDAQSKILRQMLDTWITQHSINDGVSPPGELSNNKIDQVITKIRTSHALN